MKSILFPFLISGLLKKNKNLRHYTQRLKFGYLHCIFENNANSAAESK